MNKKIALISGVISLFIAFIITLLIFGDDDAKNNDMNEGNNMDFDIKLIRTVNSKVSENYLISPYSIEMALSLLKEGANGDTYTEIDNLIGSRKINDITIKNRINVANAAFVRNKYKNYIETSFSKNIKDKYNSEILYDEFKTPEVINNWVKKETDGMIESILDKMDPNFVLGLANAIAIDVEWANSFDCSMTTSQKFTKINGDKIDSEMMHKTFKYEGAKYLSDDLATGIIVPYKKYDAKTGEEKFVDGNNLEFVAILPKGDINDYINNLTSRTFSDLEKSMRPANEGFNINLALPRFKYNYTLNGFDNVLKTLGMSTAFSPEQADFSNIMKKRDDVDNIFVGEAIHKTYIDLNENGTKAAAVTYFGMYTSGMIMEEPETVNITFDKPFIYMIRDEATKEMLFFGVIYEPSKWTGSTCSES